jgi:hypothetical protein
MASQKGQRLAPRHARTAPYMHDGSLSTLQAVVEFYDRGGVGNRGLTRRPPQAVTNRSHATSWLQLAKARLTITSPLRQQLAVGDGGERRRESNRVGVGRPGYEPAASESAIWRSARLCGWARDRWSRPDSVPRRSAKRCRSGCRGCRYRTWLSDRRRIRRRPTTACDA